jgi:hypothetical protein
MKFTASGGTDAASIVLFWPDNLPDDADAQLASDPLDLIEKLREEARIILFPCDSDGGYTVAVYVNDDVPAELAIHCRNEQVIAQLLVRGEGYFGGIECMFKYDARFLKKHPAVGEKLSIPEGRYLARVYSTEIPEGLYEEWLMSQSGARAVRLCSLHRTIAACAVAGAAAALIALFRLGWQVGMVLLSIEAAIVIAALAMSRTTWYQSVARARIEFEKNYPAYVVSLE